MSTHPHSDHDDLDRTDELPRLDVAAYEAQLAAEANDTLASTDTWAVEDLRKAEQSKQGDVTAIRFQRSRAQPPEPPKTSDVTLDATRILGRIQQLESELGAAKGREADLQARFDRLSADLAAKEKEARTLSADNARLSEQRSIVLERVRSLEQQLEGEADRFERDITQQRELLAAEQSAATTARLALEQQLAELATLAAQLRADNARIDDEAKAATQLAKTQIEVIEQFKQRLASEEKNSAQLARHLAAKIAEHASAEHEIARREGMIRTLTEARDDLATLLEAARTKRESLEAQLDERAGELATLGRTLDASQLRRDMLTREVESARARLQELEAESKQAAAAQEVIAELQKINVGLEQRMAGMEQVIRARDTLMERLRAELQLSQDERTIMADQLEKSRARNKSMAREIFARDNQIATLKADLAVHAETLAAIREDVNRTATAGENEHPDRILEPVDHDGDIILLDKKMMTIGRTSDNDICIPSKLVSRNHARLLIGPNGVIIEDAGSTNGCIVNDVQVKQQLMREGDVLSVGDLKYRLRPRAVDTTRSRDNVIPFQ